METYLMSWMFTHGTASIYETEQPMLFTYFKLAGVVVHSVPMRPLSMFIVKFCYFRKAKLNKLVSSIDRSVKYEMKWFVLLINKWQVTCEEADQSMDQSRLTVFGQTVFFNSLCIWTNFSRIRTEIKGYGVY